MTTASYMCRMWADAGCLGGQPPVVPVQAQNAPVNAVSPQVRAVGCSPSIVTPSLRAGAVGVALAIVT